MRSRPAFLPVRARRRVAQRWFGRRGVGCDGVAVGAVDVAFGSASAKVLAGAGAVALPVLDCAAGGATGVS